MEFVIVLPIYFLLLGFAFVIGELSLHAIRQTASAYRVYAMSTDATDSNAIGLGLSGGKKFIRNAEEVFEEFKCAMTFDYDRDRRAVDAYTEKTSDFESGVKKRVDCVVDGSFRGSWWKAVGAVVEDQFTLTPVTKRMVQFWYRNMARMTTAPEGTDEESELDKALINDGRMRIAGKDLSAGVGGSARHYGYISLQRNEASRFNPVDLSKKPYRTWSEEALRAGDVWLNHVTLENFGALESDNIVMVPGMGPVAESGGWTSHFSNMRNESFDAWTHGE